MALNQKIEQMSFVMKFDDIDDVNFIKDIEDMKQKRLNNIRKLI